MAGRRIGGSDIVESVDLFLKGVDIGRIENEYQSDFMGCAGILCRNTGIVFFVYAFIRSVKNDHQSIFVGSSGICRRRMRHLDFFRLVLDRGVVFRYCCVRVG